MSNASPQTGRIVKHSTIYAIGNISRQLVGFLMLPVYTRYLSPADYGVVGLLTFAMAIMEPFFGARLGEAMPKFYFQENNAARKNAVISTALIITGVVSACTSLILFFFREQTSSLLFGSKNFELAVGLFGILILTQAVEYYGMTFIRILQLPKLFISVSLSKLVIQIALNLSLVVWLKLGVMGVVISGVASSSLYALGLAIYIIYKNGSRFDRTLAKGMLTFSWPLWFVGLASLYIYSGNRYYIRIFGSLDDVGLYELAAKFATILTFLAWQPFNQFWETERFNYYNQQNGDRIFANTFRFISTLLIVIALCIGLAAEPVIRLMAAPAFHQAYLAVPILTLAFLFSCLTNFVNFSFLVKEKTRSISYIGYVTAAIVTVFNFLLIPTQGFIGAAVALTIALFFQFLATYHRGRAHFNMGLEIRPLAIQIGLAGTSFLLSTFVFYSANIWIDILAKALLLALSLVALLTVLLKSEASRSQLKSLLASVKARFARPAHEAP